MALAVIGGLVFSTVLSLIFVPAMFMMMDDVGQLSWKFGKRLLSTNSDDDAGGHPEQPKPTSAPPQPKPQPQQAAAASAAAPAKGLAFWRSK
jgi:hypothetical protein